MSLGISFVITNCFLDTTSLFSVVKDSPGVRLEGEQDQVKRVCPDW